MALLLYNSALFIFELGIRLASVAGNKKATLWLSGRKNWRAEAASLSKNTGKTHWVHCSSLGEFEQGRPLIESIRNQAPDCRIVLTFFSPSGYQVRKNYPVVDKVLYLPLDGHKNAMDFINLIDPDFVYFIKYDYWYHFLTTLKKKNIPVYIISGIFRKGQIFFSWYGVFFKRMLNNITHFFLQDKSSADLLNSIGFTNYTITGDTRFDRVAKTSQSEINLPLLEAFKSNRRLLVCGSTWPEDESIILKAFNRINDAGLCLVIAPHDISRDRIMDLLESIKKVVKNKDVQICSETDTEKVKSCRILILDTMGQLSFVFAYANMAYIGGGFGGGIHNTLEAATFGVPVFFGPKHDKFREAIGLIKAGGAFCINSEDELVLIIKSMLEQDALLSSSGKAAKAYVQANTGATGRIMVELGGKFTGK